MTPTIKDTLDKQINVLYEKIDTIYQLDFDDELGDIPIDMRNKVMEIESKLSVLFDKIKQLNK